MKQTAHTCLSLLYTRSASLQCNESQQHTHASLSSTSTYAPHTNTQLQPTHVKRLLLKLTREPNTWRIEALMQKLCWPENKHDIQILHTHKHDMAHSQTRLSQTWHGTLINMTHKHDTALTNVTLTNMCDPVLQSYNRMILCCGLTTERSCVLCGLTRKCDPVCL